MLDCVCQLEREVSRRPDNEFLLAARGRHRTSDSSGLSTNQRVPSARGFFALTEIISRCNNRRSRDAELYVSSLHGAYTVVRSARCGTRACVIGKLTRAIETLNGSVYALVSNRRNFQIGNGKTGSAKRFRFSRGPDPEF